MKDKNGNHLEILDTVAIPEPSADDIWNNEFVATIVDVDLKSWIRSQSQNHQQMIFGIMNLWPQSLM